MGKSFLERLARGLGKSTSKLVEKAKEKGLDKKAGKLVEKAQAKLKDLVKEYEEGQNEGREEREAASDKDGEHASEGEGLKRASSEGDVSEDGETGGAAEPGEDRQADAPAGETGGARST